jgi:hypothetical protein
MSFLPVLNIPELKWCAEALEAYGIGPCTEYPATTHTSFHDIEILTGVGPAALYWISHTPSTTGCGEYVAGISNVNPGGKVDIYYS